MSKNKPETALEVRDLHKEFVLPQHKRNSVKQAFVNMVSRNGRTVQKVLDGVSFEVNKGDFFGIVGRNGSGKSTLLKLLAGVYAPTRGEVIAHGGLTPFIELGVGFNPELSGRDNVFLNGALLGFSRSDMEAMYDEIVDFAELAPFMDQKLKNYSSGMQVRLAFSIAIKAHSDVLIFDEVLAVGDEAFQRKCLDVFEDYKAKGQTVILVTHDMETVKQYCSRAMLLSKGKIVQLGNPQKVAREYSRLNQEEIDKESGKKNLRTTTIGLRVVIEDMDGKGRTSFDVGECLSVTTSWQSMQTESLPNSIVVNIYRRSGEHVTGFKTKTDGLLLGPGDSSVTARIKLDLFPGKYYLLVQSLTKDDEEIETIIEGPEFTIKMQDGMKWAGLVNLEHEWVSR